MGSTASRAYCATDCTYHIRKVEICQGPQAICEVISAPSIRRGCDCERFWNCLCLMGADIVVNYRSHANETEVTFARITYLSCCTRYACGSRSNCRLQAGQQK